MAADNAIFVYETRDRRYAVCHGCLSAVPSAEDDIMTEHTYETKAEAFAGASRLAQEYEFPIEYGIIDLSVKKEKKRRV
jgi:hypothetical protein